MTSNLRQRPSGIAVLSIALAVALSACRGAAPPETEQGVVDAAPQSVQHDSPYFSKTPYAPQQDLHDYQPVPAGFEAVFTQHVARHGSRGLSSRKYDDLSLQVWQKARDEGALTALGEAFGPAVEQAMAAHEKLGYGNLSALGMREHRELAGRVQQRLPALLSRIAGEGRHIDIVSSGKDRAVDSALNFSEGLVAAEPALAGLVDPPRTDADQLYFHKAAANADYAAYLEQDARLAAVGEELHALARTRAVARRLLERLYTPAFVDRLAAGELTFVDAGKGETTVRNEVDAAQMIYNLYVIGPGMREEGDWGLERFVIEEDGEWLAYLNDAEDFYGKGPGFAGEDITYRMAGVLLDDFFVQAERRIAGEDGPGAVFRFAHAEQIVPLAALMRLPGSTQPQPVGQLYDYANNPWRGALVSPMSANVQWDLFEGQGEYLVRMLYNEREVPFKDGCTPVAPGSVFYAFDELLRCFDRSDAGR